MYKLTAHFEGIFPELKSRLTHLARKFQDPDEAFSEMSGSCWRNAVSKFQRTGELLPASALAFVAFKRHQSGRVISGYSTTDAMADQSFKSGRARILYLSQLTTNKKRYALDDGTVGRITSALSSSERERPDVRAITRLDWAAFACRLPARLQTILHALAIGERKGPLARRLNISAGRLTQLRYVLADEIKAFFGAALSATYSY